MTIETFLRQSTDQLEAAGISTARLDCLVLLEDVLHKDRTQLLAHDDQVLTKEQLALVSSLVKRRITHEPLSYIRGRSEFYGHVFTVSPDTLEPRPETETMVTLFIKWCTEHHHTLLRVIDVGTGSGAIAITVKLACPAFDIVATEIHPSTLKIARKNAKELGADITFIQGNLIDSVQVSSKPTVLLCNLPYVPDSHTINQAAMQEPPEAIFGGADGLDLYRELFNQIDERVDKPVAIFTESLPFQHHGLATIARQHGYLQELKEDFIQLFVSL